MIGSHRRADIDGLRALAIIPVVLLHAGVPGIPGGFVGVDVFFVISGFLIARLLRAELAAGSFSLARFYERRARRILPALFVVVAASLVVGWVRLLPAAFEDLGASSIAALFSVSNIWFWREAGDYFSTSSELMPLLHTWSLGVEEQFYIFFPLILLGLWRWRRSAVFPTLAVLSLASFAVSSVASFRDPGAAAFYLTPSRAWELGVGVLLTFAPAREAAPRWQHETMALAGLGAILAAMLVYNADTPFPGVAAALPCVGAAAIIYAGGRGQTVIGRFLCLPPMVFLGLISYSLYLWHWPVLAFTRDRLGVLDLPFPAGAAAVLATVLLAALSWRYVEIPFRRGRSHSPRLPLLAAAAAAVGLGAVGALIVAGHGIPERLAPGLRVLLQKEPALLGPDGMPCFERLPEAGLCRIGSPGPSPVFLLWGDSHAQALAPGVDVAAAMAGEAGLFAGASACPPLLGVIYPANPRCDPLRAAVLAEIRNRPELHTVILVGRWTLWQTGLDPFEGIRPADRRQIDDPNAPGAPGPEGVVPFGLEALVETLLGLGRDVVIIETAPEFAFDVTTAVMARARWGWSIPKGPDASDYAARNAEISPVLARLAAQDGVRVIPIADLLCTPDCLFEIDGRPAYRDDDHFSVYAARTLLGPLLADRIWGTVARR